MAVYGTNTRTSRRRGTNKKRWLYILVSLIIIAAIGFWIHERPSNKKIATIPSSTSLGSPANIPSSSQSGNSATSSPPANSTAQTPTTSQATLIAPWGNFVSNHHPGEDGSPTSETSTCNTTPGATCYIRFTNGSQIRKLGAKIAGGNGAVIWNWDVKSAGFSSGSWQITAIATLNGKVKSAADSLQLVIK